MSPGRDASSDQVREVAEAVRAPDLPRAIDLARRHLAAGLTHPMFLNLRAYWHEREGRLAEAFADLETARKAAPNDPVILNAFGLIAARLGRMDEASAAFDAAARAEPSFAQAHFNGAWAAEALGELDRAKMGYQRAIEIAPAAEAHASLAWLCARTAAWDEARASAKRALSLAPDRPIPYLALATADLNTGDARQAEQYVRKALALPTVSRLDKGIALGLLGDCLDRAGNADAAFDAYAKSNALFRVEFGGQISSRSRETVSSMAAWLRIYFAAAQPRDWLPRAAAKPGTGGPRAHVFLVGFPRSGTTLLEQVLASHQHIASMDEKEALSDSVRAFMRDPAALDRLRDANDGELEAARARYWTRVRGFGLDPQGKVFVDKLALNSIKLPLISRLFPEAKILFAVRDPRDVVWGCFRQRFQMNAAMLEFTSLEGTVQLYDGCMRLFETYRDVLPITLHTIRNEDLVQDFEGQMRQVCTFIGVPWDEAMRAFAKRGQTRAISTPSSVQVARGLYASGGQWKRYERQLQPILPIVQPWVERFGYGGA